MIAALLDSGAMFDLVVALPIAVAGLAIVIRRYRKEERDG